MKGRFFSPRTDERTLAYTTDQVWKSHKTRPYRHKIALIIHVKWQLKIGRVSSTTTVSNVSKRAPSTLQIGKRSSHFLQKSCLSKNLYIYKNLIKHVMNRTYIFMIKKGIKSLTPLMHSFDRFFFSVKMMSKVYMMRNMENLLLFLYKLGKSWASFFFFEKNLDRPKPTILGHKIFQIQSQRRPAWSRQPKFQLNLTSLPMLQKV